MPTVTDVVTARIAKWQSQIEQTEYGDLDNAILNYVICQLVDASFSGGGGGGSTSAATIASGINSSSDIDTIATRLTSIDTKTISQSDIVTAIQSAADIDTIISRLISIDTKTIAQSDIVTAIQSAADIDTIITRLTSIETLAGTSNANTLAISNKTGTAYQSVATIQRAANTTPYIANDVYGAAFELPNFAPAGGHVFLSNVRITFNISALPSGMAGFLLYLYSVTPPSAVADNGAFSLPAGDRFPVCLTPEGIDLGTASLALGGGSVVLDASKSNNINIQLKTATGSTSVWGYLVTRAGFTPAANSETATIVIHCLGV
jgi:hypothetical protein